MSARGDLSSADYQVVSVICLRLDRGSGSGRGGGAAPTQTGYLTIESVRRRGALIEYQLGWPNLEVYASLNDALLRRFTPPSGAVATPSSGRLYDLLLANDFAGMETLIGALFDGIPGEWFTKNSIAQYEGYYASVFYAYFASLGLDIVAEESGNAGRLDMAVRFNGQIYLFEFKVVELNSDGRALQQIKDRGYADKYAAEGKPIHLIGVEFSRERRTLAGFEVESLAQREGPTGSRRS